MNKLEIKKKILYYLRKPRTIDELVELVEAHRTAVCFNLQSLINMRLVEKFDKKTTIYYKKKERNEYKRRTFYIPLFYYKKINFLVENSFFNSKSEAIRFFIDLIINKERNETIQRNIGKKVSICITKEQNDELEKMVKEGFFLSTSEAIRVAIREGLIESDNKLLKKKSEENE